MTALPGISVWDFKQTQACLEILGVCKYAKYVEQCSRPVRELQGVLSHLWEDFGGNGIHLPWLGFASPYESSESTNRTPSPASALTSRGSLPWIHTGKGGWCLPAVWRNVFEFSDVVKAAFWRTCLDLLWHQPHTDPRHSAGQIPLKLVMTKGGWESAVVSGLPAVMVQSFYHRVTFLSVSSRSLTPDTKPFMRVRMCLRTWRGRRDLREAVKCESALLKHLVERL